MADEFKKSREELSQASALTQKVWNRLTRWAIWCSKAPVTVLIGVAGGLIGLAIGIPLCRFFHLPFWYPCILMALGVVVATIIARWQEFCQETVSRKLKAVVRERREAKRLLANDDTRGRQIADDIYLGLLEKVKEKRN